jgi:F-type H+-transporting ATPase subunit b
VDLLAVASALGQGVARQGVTTDAEALFQINLFQVIIAAANFVIFIAIIWKFAFTPISKMLGDRKDRIEQGLKDAEQARLDRENAEAGRIAALQEARREANDILTRAQKVAEESRERDLAATREELERLRVRASAELESEKQRAIADLRAEVADLALQAAGKVIGETMTDDRQRRLVQEFLAETGAPASAKERSS